jgi:hypothetical protein
MMDRILPATVRKRYVRFWHKADIPTRSINVRFPYSQRESGAGHWVLIVRPFSR